MNIDYILKSLDKENCIDVKIRHLDKGNLLFYIASLSSDENIMELIKSLNNNKNSLSITIPNVNIVEDEIDLWNFFYAGETILFYNNIFYHIDTKLNISRSINEPDSEKTIRGSRDGFVENVFTNIGLIRRRIKSSHLKVKHFIVGSYSKTSVCLLFLDDKVDSVIVDKIVKKINKINVNSLIMSDRALEEKMFLQKKCIYPLVRYTERVDVASIQLMNNKCLIMVDNSPSIIITPTTLFDHLRHVEEFRQTPLVGTFTRIVRFISSLVSLFLIPTYYCIIEKTTINNGIFIYQNSDVSISNFGQCLIGSLILEVFRIAIVHTPTPLSSGISLVSAIILGEVSMEMGIFSKDILLLIALSSICGFATPSYELSLVNKLVQIILIIICGIFGIPGLLIASFILFVYLAEINVLGKPYLSPICPIDPKEFKNLFIRESDNSRKNV